MTGAAGFIGSQLVERLLERGDSVVALDNFDPFYDRAAKERNLAAALTHAAFAFVEADCRDLPNMRDALGGRQFDAVIHLAARAGVRPSLQDPVGYAATNVLGTQAVLELARERGAERFILASSSSVYGNAPKVPFSEDDAVTTPISPYAATKIAAELLARTYHHLYGMTVIGLRFFTVYGPRQRPDLAIRKFASLMLRGAPIQLFGDGGTRRDYTWIDDILEGVVAAIDRSKTARGSFDIINLGGHRTTTLARLVELLADALGVVPRIERQALQPGDVERTYADISKANRLLGYSPSVTVEEGIPRFVTWLREDTKAAGGAVPAREPEPRVKQEPAHGRLESAVTVRHRRPATPPA